MQKIDRRTFLEKSQIVLAGSATLAAVTPAVARAAPKILRPLKKVYRAAAIGSTGHGGFGHQMDRALQGVPGIKLIAVADDDPAGLEAAAKRTGVTQLYSDYRKMLANENIDLVSIGPRHSQLHEELVVTCANQGKHIYCEKPLATDLASADRMIEACDSNGVKLAVAVSNRASLAIGKAVKMFTEGRIGKLLRIRANGKDDRRGGGEDLMVLGYHMLDLMCLFAGNPQWVFAHVQDGAEDITSSDGHPATEPIGPVAGDCLAAMFGFPNQVHGYLESHRQLQGGRDRFCIEIFGSEGIIVARSISDVMWFEGPVFNPAKQPQWQPITTPEWDAIAHKDLWCRRQQVLDLLQAVEEDREPSASGKQLRWVQEMIQGIYASHLAQARLPLPLKQRKHPLGVDS
jgi:predicted dehydrogenase